MTEQPSVPEDGGSRADFIRRRRKRNRALFFCLLALIGIFYLMTIVRFGDAMHRSLAP
ncbi:MAG: hypothetical protein KJ747_09895 [Actinobacteria bacterium]|nr:hypothetical protein [Actinomycetota bacterium]